MRSTDAGKHVARYTLFTTWKDLKMKFNVAVLSILAATLAGSPLIASAADTPSGDTSASTNMPKKAHSHHGTMKSSKSSKSKKSTEGSSSSSSSSSTPPQ